MGQYYSLILQKENRGKKSEAHGWEGIKGTPVLGLCPSHWPSFQTSCMQFTKSLAVMRSLPGPGGKSAQTCKNLIPSCKKLPGTPVSQ